MAGVKWPLALWPPILEDAGGKLDCTGTRFLHRDHQGSVIAQADCWGRRQAVNGYDEYGIPNATNQGRFGYTGQMWLPDIGMNYYKARIYSPTLGRFLQTDPIGYKDQINLYEYVGDDPVDGRDPSGEAPGDRFDTAEDAANDAVAFINPRSIRENIEYGGDVRLINNKYIASVPVPGKGDSVPIRIAPGHSKAWYHTHADYSKDNGRGQIVRTTRSQDEFDSNNFSDRDRRTTRDLGIPGYLGTPSGRIKVLQPPPLKKTRKIDPANKDKDSMSDNKKELGKCASGFKCYSGGGFDIWGQ